MWSAEDDAFVATVPELSGCQADGKTVVEAMNNLDIVIEEWIEMAKEMGRAIPSPMYYEPVEFAQVSEDEKVPYYDSVSRTWKVVTEWGREEGDAVYIASEFVKEGLYYPFYSEPLEQGNQYNHVHEFAKVVEFLLKKPEYFSINGFEEYYSLQERELLDRIIKKLHIANENS